MVSTTNEENLARAVSPSTVAISREPNLWTYGLLAGLAAGVFNAGLVFGVAPESSPWLLAQVFIAWLSMGVVVLTSGSGLAPVKHGMFITVLLNVPWYINEAALPGKWDHLPPLVIVSLLLGAGFGLLKRRCLNRVPTL